MIEYIIIYMTIITLSAEDLIKTLNLHVDYIPKIAFWVVLKTCILVDDTWSCRSN